MIKMWNCPNCQKENQGEFCAHCGARRPVAQRPLQQEISPYAYAKAPGFGEESRTEKSHGLLITVVICVTVIVALLLGIGAYIFVQSSEPTTSIDGGKTPVPPVVTAEPLPTPTPTATGTPTPTPVKSDSAAKKAEFLEKAAQIESYAKTSGETAMTQADINRESGIVYKKWDDLLNEVYQYLKKTLSKSEFSKLRKEEIAWIKEKEAAIEAAGNEWKGGSGEPMARNLAGSDYTSERCYELIDMIK